MEFAFEVIDGLVLFSTHNPAMDSVQVAAAIAPVSKLDNRERTRSWPFEQPGR
jgi:hypothetical protein